MHLLSNFINRFSFSRKLAMTFFFLSLLTFVIINIIMNVLYATVVTSTSSDSAFNTQAFSDFSNTQILSNTQSYLQSGMDNYQQIITQAYQSFKQFQNSQGTYYSMLSRGRNPPLTSTFNSPRYDRSGIYFYSANSTFYNHPYLDKIIASSATQHYPSLLKRINVIYQSKTDENDITVRTVPATKDFYIPSASAITSRINSAIAGEIVGTDWYTDQFSLSDNTTKIISLRFLVPHLPYHLMFEVEVYKMILDISLTHIYSFPNTKIVLIKMKTDTQYSILGKNSEFFQTQDLTPFLNDGSKTILVDGYQFLVSTKTMLDHNNDIYYFDNMTGQEEQNGVTDMKLIIFLNKSETELPKIIYNNFLTEQYSVLTFILYGWSFIVLLVVGAIGIVIGDTIFSYFSWIRKKCRQYLHNPQDIKIIDEQMKKITQDEQRNLILFQNIVSIMQGIENKKKQNRKNFKINNDSYPLNRLGIDFQHRMKLKDYNRLQQIAQIIKHREKRLK